MAFPDSLKRPQPSPPALHSGAGPDSWVVPEAAGLPGAESGDDDAEDGYAEENYTYEELTVLGEVAGVVSKGLSRDVIAGLPRTSWERAADGAGGCPDDMCEGPGD